MFGEVVYGDLEGVWDVMDYEEVLGLMDDNFEVLGLCTMILMAFWD